MTSNLSQENLLKQLNAIGLHDTDAQVYLASIRMGACTIGQLTTQTKINRITVHDCVGRLINKGLLLETFSGKRRLVYPQQINQLQHLVDTKKAEVDQLQLNVTKTINILQSLHLQSDYLPHMRISKGRQGISDMIREIKEYKNGPLLTVSDSRHFDELLNVHFLDSLTHFIQPIQMILPAWFEHFVFSAYAKWLKIQTQTIGEHMKRSGGMTIWWDKVALHAYEWIYITTTIIENNPIAQMMTNSFQNMRTTTV